jgi:hypothetical protein
MRRLLLIAAAIAVVGCSHAPFYTGDGHFTDNGIWAYSRQYVIDLGPVDLSKLGKYTYQLSGLPHATFNVAIHVEEEEQNQWNVRPKHPATVRMELRTTQGELVILEESSLDSWVRGYGVHNNISELYVRGKARDIPLPRGGARPEPLGVKASGGWGTYFDSDEDQTYVLKLDILDSTMKRPARLVVVGWGR